MDEKAEQVTLSEAVDQLTRLMTQNPTEDNPGAKDNPSRKDNSSTEDNPSTEDYPNSKDNSHTEEKSKTENIPNLKGNPKHSVQFEYREHYKH